MELCRYYFAYGLLLKSNRALPGLTETKKTGKADIIFFVKKEPRYRHHVSGRKEDVQDNPQRFVFLPTADNFLLRLPDGIKFLISADASYIEATIPSTSTMEDMVMTLQGIVLGLVLN